MTPLYERGNAAKQWIFTELEKQAASGSFRVLDLACGDGSKWPLFLAAHANVHVEGIDIDAAAIARGTARPHPRLDLRVADAQRPVQQGVFDAVTAFSAMEHVVDHAAFLRTTWEALAPGGVAYLNYDAGHFRSWNVKERVMVPVSQVLARFGIEGPYMKQVNDARFWALAEAQGFRVRTLRKHNLHPLKGILRGGTDDAIRAWYALEEQLGEAMTAEQLHRVMWSSTLVLEKPEDVVPMESASSLSAQSGYTPLDVRGLFDDKRSEAEFRRTSNGVYPLCAERLPLFFKILLALGGAFLTFFFLNPNPFGGATPVIADESYFLSTAVRALERHTLPGFVREPDGAYYGGITTHAFFVSLGTGGAIARIAGVSAPQIGTWLAVHWADLLHAGRLLNGALVVLTLLFLGHRAWRWRAESGMRPLVAPLGLSVAFLLGSSVFLGIAHTAKGWPVEALASFMAGWVVIAYEWRRMQGLPRVSPEQHVWRLLALALVGFSQSLFFSMAWLWIVAALMLRHATLRQAGRVAVWAIPVAVVVLVIHWSFLENFFLLMQSLFATGDVAGTAFGNTNIFWNRFVWPWAWLGESQPILFVAVLLSVAMLSLKKALRSRLVLVLLGQMLAVFGLFHVVIGFSRIARYILPLTVVASLFAAVVIVQMPRVRRVIAPLAVIVALLVCAKTAWLFWHPSTVVRMTSAVEQTLTPSDVLVLDMPYFSFPTLNDASYAFMDAHGMALSARQALLRPQSALRAEAPPFLVVSGVGIDPESLPVGADGTRWHVSAHCLDACDMPGPEGRIQCMAVTRDRCGGEIGTVQEGVSFLNLLRAETVGLPFYLSQIRPEAPALATGRSEP
jgi:SAM-dependent methyltransferase